MPRHFGARLAVPLLLILMTIPAILVPIALADDGCVMTPTGIQCGYRGSSTTVVTVPGGSLPPLRYLAVSGGVCWYWSRYPPGFDSWDSANDQSIILTRFYLPECRSRPTPPPVVVTSERAWEIFRAFPLDAPVAWLSPVIGITNLPSRLHLSAARTFRHVETLPDGRVLEVEAHVATVWFNWADGTPTLGMAPPGPYGDPGPIRHTYALKSCPPDYRAHHLDGPKCHPVHERYPVTVTFEWHGRYRTGGTWDEIGSIDRASVIAYDVDEVLGVLVAPQGSGSLPGFGPVAP